MNGASELRDGPVFTDGKAADALRTIGDVAGALGLRQHVLRYWEEQFPSLRPLKRSGGRRLYRPADIALVARIDRLVHREGFTLRGARQVIEGRSGAGMGGAPVAAGVTPCVPSGIALPAEVAVRLGEIRDGLAAALAAG